jgi:amino-acid N-acetyltransferase
VNVALGDIARRPALDPALALLAVASLPTADISNELLEHFFFIGPRMGPFGLVGLEIRGKYALLRSLVVAPDHRGCGAGAALVAHVENYARVQGVAAVYLLTTTAEPFFARLGYRLTGRDDAPLAIRSTQEFSQFCPATSALMVKRL